jgi:hypothetical protein
MTVSNTWACQTAVPTYRFKCMSYAYAIGACTVCITICSIYTYLSAGEHGLQGTELTSSFVHLRP